MKALPVLLLVSLALVLAGCSDSASGLHTTAPGTAPGAASGAATEETTSEAPELPTVTIDASGGGEVRVGVEIADTVFERSRGLMYRTALAENRGMLFVFDREQRLTFWMRNTLIPLSIAFMDSTGRIVDIQDMEPLDDEPPPYVSRKPARYALEVNQGFFEERGVEVGDRAELPV